MAAGVVAHAAAEGVGDLGEVGNEGLGGELGEGGVILKEIVGVGDVGLVVLTVMDFHRFDVDVRREGVVGVREGWEGV